MNLEARPRTEPRTFVFWMERAVRHTGMLLASAADLSSNYRSCSFVARFADFDNLAYAERAIAELNGYQMGVS